MKKELDDQLVKDYPEIFKDRHGDPRQTLMCFGFDCGDGWYKLIDKLCASIRNHVKWCKDCPPVVAVQVKEKFGCLRFYYNGGDEFIAGLVSFAELMSASICELCGTNRNISKTVGWIHYLCPECMKKHYEGKDINQNDVEIKEAYNNALKAVQKEIIDKGFTVK